MFCTCNEASSVRVVDNIVPTHLIIDEAAMATEPEAMIPIQLADHVTLIGDHMQLQVITTFLLCVTGNTIWYVLQPVITYNPAKEKGLGCSLFERYAILSQRNGESKDKHSLKKYLGAKDKSSLLMLKTQYRMVY